MKPQSAKAKGRRLALEAIERFFFWLPDLDEDNIYPTSSGAPGEDIQMSPLARLWLPFAFECKNVEKLNIHEAMEQARSHAERRKGLFPAVIFRRNRTLPAIVLDLEDFLSLWIPARKIQVEANLTKGEHFHGNQEKSRQEDQEALRQEVSAEG